MTASIVSGNKGAVGVSFHFSGTSFGFVNCHLTSGSDKVLRCILQMCLEILCALVVSCTSKKKKHFLFCCISFCLISRRNQNFVDILRLLSLGDKQLFAFDISLRFTHLFWCGDLNYRLDLDVQVRLTLLISLFSCFLTY